MLLNKSVAALAIVAGAALAACSQSPRAPKDAGVCWRMTSAPGPKAAYAAVAYQTPGFDTCAAYLEATRIEAKLPTLIGAYQGWFLNLRPEGVYMSRHLDIAPMLALVRTDDHRLAQPSAAAPCVAVENGADRPVARSLELPACVKRLFAGTCPAPGQALNGRWGQIVMRSTAGRIERRDADAWVLMTTQRADCSLPIR